MYVCLCVCIYVYTEPTLLMDVMMDAVSTLMCTFPLAAPSVRLDPPANLGAEATKVRRGYKDCSCRTNVTDKTTTFYMSRSQHATSTETFKEAIVTSRGLVMLHRMS